MIQDILSRLDGVQQTQSGYVARCPAHDDKSPSLSVGESNDGKILLHCFAGCTALDVVESVGLSLTDLFPEKLEHSRPGRPRPDYKAMLFLARHEFRVLVLATDDLAHNKPLKELDLAAVRRARENILGILEALGGHH